jgi:hypothetical protein
LPEAGGLGKKSAHLSYPFSWLAEKSFGTTHYPQSYPEAGLDTAGLTGIATVLSWRFGFGVAGVLEWH